MRIISGEKRGKKLFSRRGMQTRPTSDRVREAVFSILSFRVPGAVVLDLFSGTGALGLEALSRGAASSVFIDKETEALSVLHRNIAICDMGYRSRVIRWDIRRNLRCIESYRPQFTLVFMDPPYGKNLVTPALSGLSAGDCLAGGATLVIEHSDNEPVDSVPEPFRCVDQRRYGKTLVSFLSYMV